MLSPRLDLSLHIEIQLGKCANTRQGAAWKGGFQGNRKIGKVKPVHPCHFIISVNFSWLKMECLFFFWEGKSKGKWNKYIVFQYTIKRKNMYFRDFLWDLGFNFPLFTVFICFCLARNRAFEVLLTKLICLKFDSSRFPSSYEFVQFAGGPSFKCLRKEYTYRDT